MENMNKVEKFAKTSMIYFLGQVATKIVSFFLLPLYSNRFSTELYGYFDYSTSILNVIVPLVCLEIWSCILRFIFDYSDKKGKYKVITNGMSIFFVSFTIYTVGFICCSMVWDIDFGGYIYLYGAVLMLQYLYCSMARGLGKNWDYMITGVISSTTLILINILLILVFHKSVETLFISGIISGILQVIILELRIKVIKHFNIKQIDSGMIRNMLKFSFPLCVNTVAFWLLTSYSRYPIKQVLGMEQNGIFGMASRFTVILSLFVSIFNMAWQELTFSIGNESDRGDTYTKGIDLLLKFLCCGILLLIPFTKIAFTVINESYKPALAIIPMYYLGTLANSLSSFLGNVFSAEKQNKTIFYSTCMGAIVNVVVIHLTIRKIGLHGVTVGLFLGFFVTCLMRVRYLNKYVEFAINKKFMVTFACLFALVTVVFYRGNNIANVISLIVSAGISCYIFKDIIKLFAQRFMGIVKNKK